MMHLKNISAPLIDPRGKHPDVLPLFTEDGRNWYEEQKKFQPHTLKMMYDNNGIIRSVSKDVSLLCPDGMSVIELPDTDEYRKVDNTGDWLVKDVQIVKREGPEQRENSPISIGAESVPFKFELSQLVTMRISDEWGEVQARAQYANGENQYLIHYQAADGRATTEWFGGSMLIAMEDKRHPGCPVFACIDLPEGAVLEDDKEEWSPDGELVITGIVDGKPRYSRIEVNNGHICLIPE